MNGAASDRADMTLADFPVRLGTSGARGLVADFTDAYCSTFTRALLSLPGMTAGAVLIGHDLRPSSPAIAAACIAAAEDAGLEVHFAGALPTPALALACRERRLPAIMVTGSHIPGDRNGLKAYTPRGEITKMEEQAMLKAKAEAPPPRPLASRPADPSVLRRYAARYLGAFPRLSLQGMRIGVYEHSTVVRDVLHEVLGGLGAETLALGRSDVFLPVDTEAIRPEDRSAAADWAERYGFDAIVSADGDADRPLVGDERGLWLRGDVVGILAARAVGAATVVTPVSTSTALERSGFFRKIVRTRIGSPYVIAAMQQETAILPVAGFEANGGFLLGSDVLVGGRPLAALATRDALLPMLLVLAAARRDRVPLSRLVQALPQRSTHSDRLRDFPPRAAQELLAALRKDRTLLESALAPDSGGLQGLDLTDGLRASFANGEIVHVRASGNAPELRCYTESGDAGKARALCEACLARLGRHAAR